MQVAGISEYVSGHCQDPSLLVLFRFPTWTAAEMFCQYLPPETACHRIINHGQACLGVIQSRPLPYIDMFLHRLDCLLEDINEEFSTEKLTELVEARLIPGGIDATREFEDAAAGKMILAAAGHEIVMETGLAFGTGAHPSTRLMISVLTKIAARGAFPPTVLDMGCGSGVLSLLSAKLGAGRVVGVEVCPEAITAATNNVAANHLQEKVIIMDQLPADIKNQFHLVLANLSASTLGTLLDQLTDRVRPDGFFVLSGIMGNQDQYFIEKLCQKDFRLVAAFEEENWKALWLEKKNA